MNRVIAYIDGYNLYHGLREQGWKRFYWLIFKDFPIPHTLCPQTLRLKTWCPSLGIPSKTAQRPAAEWGGSEWIEVSALPF